MARMRRPDTRAADQADSPPTGWLERQVYVRRYIWASDPPHPPGRARSSAQEARKWALQQWSKQGEWAKARARQMYPEQ